MLASISKYQNGVCRAHQYKSATVCNAWGKQTDRKVSPTYSPTSGCCYGDNQKVVLGSRITSKPRAKVSIDHRSYWRGYDAGLTGKPSVPVPVGIDPLSWQSGYIEGEAAR